MLLKSMRHEMLFSLNSSGTFILDLKYENSVDLCLGVNSHRDLADKFYAE